ncbi:Uncharacterized protein APZ42_015577 [Daphnia magna]|uniref:Uncharacterized protein n=1 Tax=Daphnia magna TaxID=35525 RepID=A0A162NVN0_9CRUS|nr:Uncharacterized protein APZ42_015577 [Daphnia magna]
MLITWNGLRTVQKQRLQKDSNQNREVKDLKTEESWRQLDPAGHCDVIRHWNNFHSDFVILC